MTHPRRHPLIWLALVAMLAVALLPTVSHALAHARAGAPAWAEVCTPQGLSRVAWASAAGRDTVPLQAAGHWEHCPLCTLAADHPSLPPAPAQAGVRRLFDAPPLPHTAQAPRAHLSGFSAQPRGPPASA